MSWHRGDVVTACRQIEDMDVPAVPEGTEGTVESTTVFGRPKRVCFTVRTIWGKKRACVNVHRGDVG
jgi:hypothetical protein